MLTLTANHQERFAVSASTQAMLTSSRRVVELILDTGQLTRSAVSFQTMVLHSTASLDSLPHKTTLPTPIYTDAPVSVVATSKEPMPLAAVAQTGSKKVSTSQRSPSQESARTGTKIGTVLSSQLSCG